MNRLETPSLRGRTTLLCKWKTTSNLFKMEDDPKFGKNGRQPQFCWKCKKTSTLFSKRKATSILFLNERRPYLFNGRQTGWLTTLDLSLAQLSPSLFILYCGIIRSWSMHVGWLSLARFLSDSGTLMRTNRNLDSWESTHCVWKCNFGALFPFAPNSEHFSNFRSSYRS